MESDFVLVSLSAIRHTSSASSVVFNSFLLFSDEGSIFRRFSSYFAFSSSLEQASGNFSQQRCDGCPAFPQFPQLWYAGLFLPRGENSAEVSDLVLDAPCTHFNAAALLEVDGSYKVKREGLVFVSEGIKRTD